MNWTIEILPALIDNYILMLSRSDGQAICIDPSEAAPVIDYLEKNKLKLSQILNTHHHTDHVGGNLELKEKTGCRIAGSRHDEKRIPGLDEIMSDNYEVEILGLKIRPLEIPGHTLGHIAYYFPDLKMVASGDTLFTLGCGRLFEGTPKQMFDSLKRLSQLPPNTKVYCGHEYTQGLAAFAVTLDPENRELLRRRERVNEARAKGLPTVPGTIGEELSTNPFLRASSPAIRKQLGMERSTDLDVFTEMRRRKDNY